MTEPNDDADGIFPITAAEAAILYDLGWSSGYGWERDWDWWRDDAPADDDATRIRLAEHITAIRAFRARSEAAVRAYLADAPQPTPHQAVTAEQIRAVIEANWSSDTKDATAEAVLGLFGGAPQPIGDGWMPIETMPKDGTHFLAYEPGGDMYRAFYHDEGFIMPMCGQRVTSAPQPTRWQPLPAPPTT